MCLNNIKNNNFIKDLLNINQINEVNDQIKNNIILQNNNI